MTGDRLALVMHAADRGTVRVVDGRAFVDGPGGLLHVTDVVGTALAAELLTVDLRPSGAGYLWLAAEDADACLTLAGVR